VRRALDALYLGAGIAGAVCLAAICATVLVQVGFNITDRVAVLLTGQAIGLVLPSYAEFTGYFLAASTFLAGAYTLGAGAHIRVRLVVDRLGARARRAAEIWAAGAGAVLMAYFALWSVLLTEESWRFGDVSPGMLALPLWVPQAAMTLGVAIMAVALADRFVMGLAGRLPDDEPEGDG
jgi:TRAP-type C4-dicarboxylate transport system permease small subunit